MRSRRGRKKRRKRETGGGREGGKEEGREEKLCLDFSRQYIEGFSHRDHGDRVRQQRSVAPRRRFPSGATVSRPAHPYKACRILSRRRAGRQSGSLAVWLAGWLVGWLRCTPGCCCGCTNASEGRGLNRTRGRNITFPIRSPPPPRTSCLGVSAVYGDRRRHLPSSLALPLRSASLGYERRDFPSDEDTKLDRRARLCPSAPFPFIRGDFDLMYKNKLSFDACIPFYARERCSPPM